MIYIPIKIFVSVFLRLLEKRFSSIPSKSYHTARLSK